MFSEIPCVCIPIFSNTNKHQSEIAVVGLYLAFTDRTERYINFSHPDENKYNCNLFDIQLHPKSLVFNKKALMYHGFNEGIDLNSYLHYYADHSIVHKEFYTKSVEVLSNKYFNSDDLGHIIPLAIQLDYAKKMAEYVLVFYRKRQIDEKCIEFCNDFVEVFYEIEKEKILIDGKWENQNYMWYTATTRPSNAWNNFNFSAMNKRDGTRNKIRSRFEGGKIVQFDYDAFHIKLLAKVLDYKFYGHPYDDIKKELALDIPYDEIKSKVFQNIYGSISHQFMQHTFFASVQAMIDELYLQYKNDGAVKSWFYEKLFRDIQDETPNKIFNYVLQSLETEYNVRKIKKILPYIKDKRSVFMLYLYDAFVFDIHPGEMDLVNTLQSAFETDDMSIKIYVGDTFGDIKRI
jgi:hypothetical protein